MTWKRIVRATLVALAFLFLPTAAFAQTGTIAGVVKDTTGAVMPGVTVEAASPALIEKVRTAVTDGEGQYKIVDLRPGAYTVTFSLTGFNAVKREGIELSAGVTAPVNAELRIGSLAETITVSGASPMVDVQNTRQQTTMNRDVLDVIPVGRSPQSYAVLVPGVVSSGSSGGTNQDLGGNISDRNATLRVHGSRSQEMPLLYDGMRYNNMNATPGGGHLIWAINNGTVQEYTIETGGLSAEAEASGVRQNAIPKAGGNTFLGFFYSNFTNHSLQAANTPDPSKASSIAKLWDLNTSYGGPIKQDKLWFFGSHRYWGTHEQPAGVYQDKDPLDFVYTPDLSRPGIAKTWNHSQDVRLTWQATAKHKFSLWADDNERCWCHYTLSSTTQPDASGVLSTYPNLMAQVTWSAPITNRLLIDAGYTVHPESWGRWPQPYLAWGTDPAVELSTGINFRANGSYTQHRSLQMNGKFFVSYVTGSHAFKVGFQEMHGWRTIDLWTLGTARQLRFLDGVPNSLTQYTYPYSTRADVPAYNGVFAQDQWTINRMTINAGLRYEWLISSVPAQTYPATPLVDARSYPAISDAPNWKDLLPRLGLAYDLFGNNKTAVKVNVGRYVQAVTTAYSDQVNPIVASVDSATRTWTDTNGNFVPDCDLKNVAINGECGRLSNQNFGKNTVTTTYDPDVLKGWGKRPYDWEVQAAIQQELLPGLSVNATYTRHWWANFLSVDNLATSPSDYSPYCITAPVDSRLPSGGGNQICGFYDINPNKFGQVNNYVTFAKNFGNISDVYNGVDVAVNARLPRGILVQGGFSTGHEVVDICDVAGKVDNAGSGPPDIQRGGVGTPLLTNLTGVASPSTLYCHFAPPFQTQVKLLGSYPLPWDMAASATFQSVPGPQISASYNVRSAQIEPSLGRPLAAGPTATTSVQLIAPGTMYGDWLNQLDSRLTKTFRMARGRRIQAQFDFYNLLNVAARLTQNNAFGASWQTPTAILPGRLFKFGVQLDF